jgi:hypothetical protein
VPTLIKTHAFLGNLFDQLFSHATKWGHGLSEGNLEFEFKRILRHGEKSFLPNYVAGENKFLFVIFFPLMRIFLC